VRSLGTTIYGVLAVWFMMVMSALESRGHGHIPGIALGCPLSSVYGFLAGDMASRGGRGNLDVGGSAPLPLQGTGWLTSRLILTA
jgi:hypothetical protein